MFYGKRIAALALAIGALAGCSSEDFSGAYSNPISYSRAAGLNITGDTATYFVIRTSDNEIQEVAQFEVSYKDEKMFLDKPDEQGRFVYKRGVDEQSLECLNCEDHRDALPTKWAFVKSEPFPIEEMLEEQEARERAAALAAEKAAAEKAKLGPFQGDWVARRRNELNPLSVMGIYTHSGVRVWRFDYDTAKKMADFHPEFSVDGEALLVSTSNPALKYTLSEDGNQLRCISCDYEMYWTRLNPAHEKDLEFIRNLAGNPKG